MKKNGKGLFDLRDRVAVITGGHAWLGYDIACILAEYGCHVIITSRDKERAQKASRDVSKMYGVNALGVVLEQTSYESVQKMARAAYEWKGRVDILVNNAGGGSGVGECAFLKRNPDNIKRMIDVNLTGVIFCCQAVGRLMAENRCGSIINIASIAALVGRNRTMYHNSNKMEQPIEYAAAKAGVLGLTKDLSVYMSPFGIRVNAISPGGFDKGDLPPAFVDAYSELTPLGRMGKMGADIKGAALFLASDASTYVTGHNLVVDGGFHICK